MMKVKTINPSNENVYAIITFAFIIIADVLAIFFGFGGSLLGVFSGDIGMFYSYESLLISSAVICSVCVAVLYAYKNNLRKIIVAIGCANLIISLAPYILNSVYYPFSFMVADILFDISSSFSDLRFLTGEFISIPLCVICFVLNIKLKRNNETKSVNKKTYKIISVLTVCFFAFVNIFNLFITTSGSSDIFNYSAIGYYFKNKKQYSNLEIYNSINESTSSEQADALLKEQGFFPHTEIEKYINDKEDLKIQLDTLKEYIITGDETVYTKPTEDGYVSYYNPCIIISTDQSGTINKKKITFDSSDSLRFFDLISISDGNNISKSEEVFQNLKIGQEKESALKQIEKYAVLSSLKTEYDEFYAIETYNFSAYEDISFLGLDDRKYFDGYIVFEDGFIKGGNYICTHEHTSYEEESNDIIEEVTKYTIK